MTFAWSHPTSGKCRKFRKIRIFLTLKNSGILMIDAIPAMEYTTTHPYTIYSSMVLVYDYLLRMKIF